MDILHYLDVAIGFTLSMMVLATLIGTTTAAWLAAIRSRVRNLEAGLQHILAALPGDLTPAERKEAVGELLRDRMMNGWSPTRWLGMGATEAVGREEYLLMLLRKAAGGSGVWAKLAGTVEVLTGEKPGLLLRRIETEIVKEEAASPAAPSTVWRTRALAKIAPGLAGPLFSQFDEIMIRSEDNLTFSAKIISALLALVFLVAYPVNSFDLLARLMNDQAIAKSLVRQAEGSASQSELLASVKKQGLFGDVFEEHSAHKEHLWNACGNNSACWATTASTQALSEPGVWTTLILVSLGAPFWLGLLDKLLGLRSKITEKTQEDRQQRTETNT